MAVENGAAGRRFSHRRSLTYLREHGMKYLPDELFQKAHVIQHITSAFTYRIRRSCPAKARSAACVRLVEARVFTCSRLHKTRTNVMQHSLRM